MGKDIIPLRALLWLAVGLLLLGGTRPTAADSWGPYGQERIVDTTGRYYVVITQLDSPVKGGTFALVRAKADAEPVHGYQNNRFRPKRDKETGIRDGDKVLARGKLRPLPLHVRVSSGGTGFAVMGTYGGQSIHGGEFAWVDRTGTLRHEKGLDELFTEAEYKTFTHTVSSVWWFVDAWVVDDPGQIVLVGGSKDGPGFVKVISTADGKVRSGGDAELRAAIGGSDPRAMLAAVKIAVRRGMKGLGPHLRRLVVDDSAEMAARLEAARLVVKEGDQASANAAAALMKRVVSSEPQNQVEREAQEYAFRHLREVLRGGDSLPFLERALRDPKRTHFEGVRWALMAAGPSALSMLRDVLGDKALSEGARATAAYALRVGRRRALPALLAAIEDKSAVVARAALEAAVSIDRRGIDKELAAALDKQTTLDAALITHFVRYPSAAAVGPLVRALRRTTGDTRAQAVLALRLQTGKDLGSTAEAWERWLADQSK